MDLSEDEDEDDEDEDEDEDEAGGGVRGRLSQVPPYGQSAPLVPPWPPQLPWPV